MVARFSAAGLGLLAFAITATAGLFVHNPVEVTLWRSIFALVLFCFIGFLVGAAAQRVVAEHEEKKISVLKKRYTRDSTAKDGGLQNPSSASEALDVGES